jgi:hypothetical protein
MRIMRSSGKIVPTCRPMRYVTLTKVILTSLALVGALSISVRADQHGPANAQHSKIPFHVLAPDSTYMIDDGTAENGLGVIGGGDLIELNEFAVIPGSETITSVSIAWGSPNFPDPSLNGLPYTVAVWSDPNGDGDPTDAVLLTTSSGVVSMQGTDTFITTPVTPTTITTPNFFVGFLIPNTTRHQFPAAFDQTDPTFSNRSYGADSASGTGNIENLNDNDTPVAPIESQGLIGNFLIRADAVPAQTNPVPLINQPLVPDAAAPGGPGFTLTVNGTGFVSGASVNWNGSARATTFVSTAQLTATILASDIAIASTASVTVVNSSPGGGTSNVEFFPITLATSSVLLSRSDYATAAGSQGVGVGDFNGDGKLDLAMTDNGANAVSILLGNGDGTFQGHVDYATGGGPGWVVIGDFNRDGKLDLAVNSQSSNELSILLGNGDGTFQPAVNYAADILAGSLAVGDFSGDGNLDLASTSSSFNTVSILLGNGDGTFQSQVVYATGASPYGIAVGDLNGDGKLDLAIANMNSNAVSILLGNGDGTFQPHVEYQAGSGSTWVNAADLNADGFLDLVVANWFSETVSVLLGNGDGTFQPHVDYAIPSGAIISRVADFNGDGKLDLAVTPWNVADVVSILLGNGDGTFQAPVEFATGSDPFGLAAGDFNDDGRLDLAVANFFGNTVSVLLQATTVALSDTSLKFALQLVGTTSTAQAVTLTNSGPIALTISSITASGDFLQKNNCGSSLAAGESCTIKVAFRPSAKGFRTGSVTITDDAADSPQRIKLTGTGTVVQLSPSALDFGNQIVGTTSDPQTATITNISSEDLRILGVGLSGENFGDFAETTTCGSNLPAGGSCTINVTFTPTAKGRKHANLLIRDDGGGNQQAVPLTGTGVLH